MDEPSDVAAVSEVNSIEVPDVQNENPTDNVMVDQREENDRVEDTEMKEEDNGNEDGVDKPKLSRRAQNRARREELYLIKRQKKREYERLKRKEKKQKLKNEGKFDQCRRKKGKKMEDSSSKQRIAVDMSFDDLMSDKDMKRSVKQIGWCYTANRHSPEPFQFYVTSFGGVSRQYYDSIDANRHQDILLKTEKLEEVFDKNDVVYLTADSDNTLTKLDDSKVYVIGGIVDHNFHKGLCLKKANELGFQHAKLPIDEFVNMKARKVLTINHVYEIMVNFAQTQDWRDAFFKVIPQRKGYELKDVESKGNQSDEDIEVTEVKTEPEIQDVAEVKIELEIKVDGRVEVTEVKTEPELQNVAEAKNEQEIKLEENQDS